MLSKRKKSSFDCTNYSEYYLCQEYPLNRDAILVIVPIATDEWRKQTNNWRQKKKKKKAECMVLILKLHITP